MRLLMRVSCDLDDTLICYASNVPQQTPLAWWTRPLVRDKPLRAQTRRLIENLQQLWREIWIYTTSNRHPTRVKHWFGLHGVRINRMINLGVHVRRIQGIKSPPSKSPGAFDISVHIHDSPGVVEVGILHGFVVIAVSPNDVAWDDVILAGVRNALRAERLTGS